MFVCGLAPLLLVAGFEAVGERRIYYAHEVTTPHRFMENDCGKCHTRRWQPLVRFVTNDASARSVEDGACRKCHAESLEDHSPRMPEGAVRDCVLCHREHRDEHRLIRVADAHCIACHGDRLKTTDGNSKLVSGFRTFAGHPAFAMHREATRDEAKIRFNHAKHLQSGGVLLPHDHPANHDGKQTRVLQCTDCHQVADDGRYVQPVVYEQHCAECHRLAFTTQVAVGGPLPHETSDIVLAVMRDRLMEYARANPEATDAESGNIEDGDTRPLPRAPYKTSSARFVDQDRWEWVEQILADTQSGVFASTRNGCAYCHQVNASSDDSARPATGTTEHFRIEPTNIPVRWLTRSRFRHDSHQMIRCEDCHDAAGSSQTLDVLMPTIDVCRKCHGDGSELRGGGRARADCVECHGYHNHSQPMAGHRLTDFLSGS